jgi:hypothetical protein
MKKILALLLAAVMVLSMAACGNNANTDETQATEATETAASALEILETIWAKYGEDEKFAIIGGNMESAVDGAPGNYDMAYAENLTYNLLVPADQLASVDQAATMIHMMNANTFTCGVVHLTEGTDVAAFANTMRDAVQGNQWMCGFPETLVIATIGNYVLVAFGVNDAMNPFQTHFAEAYPNANVLFNEAIAG